jgi:hypothetical protein
MIEGDAAAMLAQFGAAGLMGWMWLSERRAAATREKQLADAHERLLQERSALDVVLRALEGSTRVLTALEVGQRQIIELLGRMTSAGPSPGPTQGPNRPARAEQARSEHVRGELGRSELGRGEDGRSGGGPDSPGRAGGV